MLSTTAKTSIQYKLIDSTFNRFYNKITKDVVLPNDPRIIQRNITQNWITGFYGFGTEMCYKQNDLLDLNLLLTFGRSITGVNYDNLSDPLYGQANYSKEYYYLVKEVVTEKITKLNATIGMEIRGMYPNRTPSISAYLGFLITPSNFFKSKP